MFIIHAISKKIEGLGSGEQINVNWAFVFCKIEKAAYLCEYDPGAKADDKNNC